MRVILVMWDGDVDVAAVVNDDDAGALVAQLQAADTVGQFQIRNLIAEPAPAILDYVKGEDEAARDEE